MINPITDQFEAMKLDIQRLKENESESVFESVTSDSPGKGKERNHREMYQASRWKP